MGVNEEQKNMGLLEALARETQVPYLSDLRTIKNKEKCYLAVHDIQEDEYSLKEWKDAARYLIGKSCSESKAQEVKIWILEHLKK